MFTLEANDTIAAAAGAASAITVTGYGMEKTSSTTAYKKLFQTQPGTSAGTIYTVPASTETLLKTITAVNPTGTARTLALWHDGTNDATAILPAISIVAGGMAIYSDGAWKFYNSSGGIIQGGVSSIAGTANEIAASAATGDVTLSLPSALTFTGKTITGGTYSAPVMSGTITGTYTLGGTPTLPAISSTNYSATTSAQLRGVLSDENGTGAALFDSASGATLINPIITNITPGANFTLTQNSVAAFTSENTGAVANTLYLKAGNVGIGTTNPGQILEVKQTTAANTGIGLYTTRNTLNDEIGFRIGFNNALTGVGMYGILSDPVAAAEDPGIGLKFYTQTAVSGAVPRLTILEGGNVGIGTTTPGYKLELSTDSAAKPTTNTWTISSDKRLKNVLGNFTDGLNIIRQLNPVRYRYNGRGGYKDNGEHVNILAQDIELIAPSLVGKRKGNLLFWEEVEELDKEGKVRKINRPVPGQPKEDEDVEILTYQGHNLQWMIVNSLKELDARVKTLEA